MKKNPEIVHTPPSLRCRNLTPRLGAFTVFVVALSALTLAWEPTARGQGKELSPEEARGKRIYLEGATDSGKVTALMGTAGIEVPGEVLPCGSCHGEDGKGRPEGGVTPSNITWSALTKPYGVTHESGREHPAYDLRSLKKAIAMGLDPAGNELHTAMPRYRMSLEAMADLLAYLKRLGSDPDPGLSEDALLLGITVPISGAGAEIGRAIRGVVEAYLADVNREGGIYSRRLDLIVGELHGEPETWPDQLSSFLKQQRPFALLGAYIAGAEEEMQAVARDLQVPIIGPFTLDARPEVIPNRYVFHTLSGIGSQARALVSFARHQASDPGPAAVVAASDQRMRETATSLVAEAQTEGWVKLQRVDFEPDHLEPAAVARQLKEAGTAELFFLGSGSDLVQLLSASAELAWLPRVHTLGSLAGGRAFEVPQAFDQKVFLAFPTLPSIATLEATNRYREMAKRGGLESDHPSVRLFTFAAGQILVEGLKTAGRELSRERLISALEGLYDFETGIIPPVTYNPNRRVGALGAFVLVVDLKARSLAPASEWVVLE